MKQLKSSVLLVAALIALCALMAVNVAAQTDKMMGNTNSSQSGPPCDASGNSAMTVAPYCDQHWTQTHDAGIEQSFDQGLAFGVLFFDKVEQHDDMADDHAHQTDISLRRINVEILEVAELRALFHFESGHNGNLFVAFAQRGQLMLGCGRQGSHRDIEVSQAGDVLRDRDLF